MNETALNRYINRPFNFHGKLTKQPILIADSKGNYLKPHEDLIRQFGYSIDFQCFPGARFSDYYFWLKNNLHKKVRQFGQIVLYIWLGTCDFTYKKGREINLRHADDNAAVSYLKFQIDRYFDFVANFPTVSIIFLEIPYYSLESYYSSKGHRDPTIFRSQDLVLKERIALVNEYIKEVNQFTSVISPRFNLDLIRFHKSKGDDHKRAKISFANFKDGIHPKLTLARYWTKRIVAHILADCV